MTTTAAPAGTAVSSRSAAVAGAPAQVESVASTSVLYQASPVSPVTAGSVAGSAQPAASVVTTPSLLGASSAPDTGPQDLLAKLGLVPGGNPVDSTLSNVESISNILADQLDQVARLTNITVDQMTSPLGAQAKGLTSPVNELTNGLTKGLGTTLKGLVGGIRRSVVPNSVVPNSVVTSSVVPGPTTTRPTG
jgi:hypothetical protein